jgi:hypothetical protein
VSRVAHHHVGRDEGPGSDSTKSNARAIVFDVKTPGPEVWKRFNPESDQPWYYGKLVKAFRKRDAGPMVKELKRTVAEMRRLPT